MASILEIDLPKLRGYMWGKGKDIAKELGITPAMLSRKLRGKSRLHLEDFNQIMLHLNADADDFIILKDKRPIQPRSLGADSRELDKGAI